MARTTTLLLIFLTLFTPLLTAPCEPYCSDSGHVAGLWTTDNRPFSMIHIESSAYISYPDVTVEHIQEFRNDNSEETEVIYYFSKGDYSVIHLLEASFNDQTISVEIIDKMEAQRMYQETNDEKYNEAFKTNSSNNFVNFYIGKVPAYTNVVIRLFVIIPLRVVSNQLWGFSLYSTLTYFDNSGVPFNEAPDYTKTPLNNSDITSWKVKAVITSDYAFKRAKCITHDVEPTYTNNNGRYLAIWDTTIDLSRDFVIFYTVDETYKFKMALSKHPQYTDDGAILISFLPKLNNADSELTWQSIDQTSSFNEIQNLYLDQIIDTTKGEYIFLIDVTRYNEKHFLDQIKEVIPEYLANLPADSYINLIAFGESLNFFRESSIKISEADMSEVNAWLNELTITRGAYDMLDVVNTLLAIELVTDYPRIVYSLSCGNTEDPAGLISQIYNNRAVMRFCSFGMGDKARYLIKNMGIAGNCGYKIINREENVNQTIPFIQSTISNFGTDVQLTCECKDKSGEITFAQYDYQAYIYQDEAYGKFILLPELKKIAECEISISYYNNFEGQEYANTWIVRSWYDAQVTDIWHQVGYKNLIIDKTYQGFALYLQSDIRAWIKEIVDTSVKYQVDSDYTVYISYTKRAMNPWDEPTSDNPFAYIPQSLDYVNPGELSIPAQAKSSYEAASMAAVLKSIAFESAPESIENGEESSGERDENVNEGFEDNATPQEMEELIDGNNDSEERVERDDREEGEEGEPASEFNDNGY